MPAQSDFIGSWVLTLRPEAGTTPHTALATLCADGTLLATPPAVEEFPSAPAGVLHVGTGHGEWKTAGKNQAKLLFLGQASNAQGSFMGMGSVTADLVLGEDRRTFGGLYAFEMSDPNGLSIATEDGTIDATRICVERESRQVGSKPGTLNLYVVPE